MHQNSDEDARIIFRWLFDETSYNYPLDVDKLFLPHTKDMGWTFRVDMSVPGQIDGFNCGVFLLGYVACVLHKMNPRRLTPMLVQGYRIRLFGECSSFKLNTDPYCIKHHKGPPWAPEKISRIILDPIPTTPLSSNKTLRATGSSRRFFLPSERVKVGSKRFRDRAIAQRKARAAEAEKQKAEITERKRIRAEGKKAFEEQKVEDEAEKARMEQIREAADQKVDSLLADGLAVELRKKGKAHQKRLKTLLEHMFFTLPEQGGGLGDADTAAIPDAAAVPDEAAEPVEDQVALLVFRQGTKGIDPPSPNAKNVRKCRINPKVGPKYCYDYDYNYFEGKTAAGVIFNYQLNPAWCEFVFELVFTQLCRRQPGCWFHVPIGSARIDEEPSVRQVTEVAVRYPQRDMDYCLPCMQSPPVLTAWAM
jgi:hypothetical protein